MEHEDQHIEAVKPTVKVNNSVSCCVCDDKVKKMGRVEVQGGKIVIELDYLPGLLSSEEEGKFIADSISVAIRECFSANPESFNPFSVK